VKIREDIRNFRLLSGDNDIGDKLTTSGLFFADFLWGSRVLSFLPASLAPAKIDRW
jgi:hypothetical protein